MSRYPAAPAITAAKIASLLSYDLSIRQRTSGADERMSRQTSMPLPLGNLMSSGCHGPSMSGQTGGLEKYPRLQDRELLGAHMGLGK